MNLKDFFATKENPPELYWSLVMEQGWVQAGVWYIKEGVAEVLSTSPATAWESDDELLEATDAALSASVQKLPEEFQEPQKTVFGVGSSWVKDGEISEENLAKIKKICTELSLTPTGFVVLPEAIAHLFKSTEGSPLNAVILGLGSQSLEISVFKLGNLVGTSTVARSVSLVDDVTEGLSRFEGASPIPSRIVIFNGRGGELEEARDTLSGANWEDVKGIKFLHTPKVEILESQKKVLATSLAGASEIGMVSKVTEAKEEIVPPVEVEEMENITTPEDSPSGEELGFIVGKDISDNAPEKIVPPPTLPVHPSTQTPQVIDSGFTAGAKSFNPSQYLAKTKNLFHGIHWKMDFSNRKKFMPLLIFLGVVFIGAILFWWFYPKAAVSVYVAPKKFEEDFDITVDPGGKSDPANGVVAGKTVESSVSGEKTKAATGTKMVGDRAKGVVSLRNGTSSNINFPAGTILVSSGDLRFTLDKATTVPAAIDADNPGTVNADVVASDIGAAYNLAKDEVFKLGNYPKADAYAKSTADFSGGASREISAVAKEDQDKLLQELTDELSSSAKKDLSEKVEPNQFFIDSLVSLEATNQSFSHKVGDEADTLKLNLSMDAKAVLADKESLSTFVKEKLKDKTPQGFVLRDSQIEYEFEFVEEDEDGRFLFKTHATINFLPELKTEEIAKQIAGKTPEVVEEYLSSVPGFTRADITLKPRFPGRFGTLPRVLKNITIEIVAER